MSNSSPNIVPVSFWPSILKRNATSSGCPRRPCCCPAQIPVISAASIDAVKKRKPRAHRAIRCFISRDITTAGRGTYSKVVPTAFLMFLLRVYSGLLVFAGLAVAADTPTPQYTQADIQQVLKTKCVACHAGKAPAGGFDATKLALPNSIHERPQAWTKAASRVYNGEMPPGAAL